MIRVAVGGATGRLGRIVCGMVVSSEDMELTGALVSANGGNVGKELYPGVIATSDVREAVSNADVYVDLTSPDAVSKIVDELPSSGVNIILGTTAVPDRTLETMAKKVFKNGTSALISSNFAIGVNVFWSIAERIAEMLSDYDIEIIETHHSGKKDSPSGTSIELLNRIQKITGIDDITYGRHGVTGGRGREIGIHSIRAGGVVGDNTVLFAGNTETLELKHSAISREAFAEGCITCIRWIHGKKDGKVHGMKDVLGIC